MTLKAESNSCGTWRRTEYGYSFFCKGSLLTFMTPMRWKHGS